jgi:hypothetical protein
MNLKSKFCELTGGEGIDMLVIGHDQCCIYHTILEMCIDVPNMPWQQGRVQPNWPGQ